MTLSLQINVSIRSTLSTASLNFEGRPLWLKPEEFQQEDFFKRWPQWVYFGRRTLGTPPTSLSLSCKTLHVCSENVLLTQANTQFFPQKHKVAKGIREAQPWRHPSCQKSLRYEWKAAKKKERKKETTLKRFMIVIFVFLSVITIVYNTYMVYQLWIPKYFFLTHCHLMKSDILICILHHMTPNRCTAGVNLCRVKQRRCSWYNSFDLRLDQNGLTSICPYVTRYYYQKVH